MDTMTVATPKINQTLMAKIEAIDLSNTRARLIQKKGFDPAVVDQAIEDYRKFLYICVMFDGKHEPTQIIDEVWHDHILHTRKYMQDCQAIAGRYIHHQPYLIEKEGCTHSCFNSCGTGSDNKACTQSDECSGTTNCQEGRTCGQWANRKGIKPIQTCDVGTCTPCNADPCVSGEGPGEFIECTHQGGNIKGGDDQFTKVEKGDFADVMPALFGRPVVYAADCGQDGGCQTGDPTCRCN